MQPRLGRSQRRFAEPAGPYASGLERLHQPRSLQRPEVLHERGQRDGVVAGEGGHRFVAVREPRDDRPPHRVGQRGKRQVEVDGLLVNQVVNYCRVQDAVSSP